MFQVASFAPLGHPMQVGPLAQVLIGLAQGHKLTAKWAGEAINRVSAIAKKQVTPAMLHSTLARIAARAVRASMLADLAPKHWDLLVKNIASGDAKIFVKPQFGDQELHGAGFHEASRGTLSHWVVIKDGQIANYQAVVPTTWNAGPMKTAPMGPTKGRSSVIPSPMRSARWKFSAPCTRSIPAWPVPSTPSIRMGKKSSLFPKKGES